MPQFATRGRSGTLLKREQIWRRDVVADRSAQIAREIDRVERDAGASVAHSRVRQLRSDPTLEGQLACFLYAVEALERHGRDGGLTLDEVVRTAQLAKDILVRHRVRPVRSRLRELHATLTSAIARAFTREGCTWRAAWERRAPGAESVPGDVLLRTAELGLLAGEARAATELLLDAEVPCDPEVPVARLRLARARILRLAGDLQEASAVLSTISTSDDELARELAWERAAVASTAQRGLEPLAVLIRSDRAVRTPLRLLRFRLWAHAVSSRAWIAIAPRAASLRRIDTSSELDRHTLRFAVELDRAYAGGQSFERRRARLGDAFECGDRIASVEDQMLVFAAAARWLHRVKQPRLAALALARYRAASVGTSGGANDDVLAIAGDLAHTITHDDAPAIEELPLGSIPTSTLGRATVLSGLAIELARTYGRHLSGRWRASDDERSERIVEYAHVLARYLGEMKGLVMKLGQVLSYCGLELPADAVEVLRTLQDRSSAFTPAAILDVLERDLGAPVTRLFSRFEETPFGTGSIGQVHAAMLHDGRRVAVKIQYPGIERAIRSDLRAIGLLRPLLRTLVPNWNVSGLVDELADQLLGECDYLAEADHQEHFRRGLEDEPGLCVPAVIRSHTGRRVLTSDLVDGVGFNDFCARATAVERNRAGELVTRFVIRTLVAERWFNTDFHPGNFLFADGRMWCIDFGNVRSWSGDEGHGFRWLLEAIATEDVAMFRRAALALGMLAKEIDFERAFALLNSNTLIRRMNGERPSRIDRSSILRDMATWFSDHPDAREVVLPPAYLFAFRAYFGSFALLAELGAEGNWQRLVLDVLAEHDARRHPEPRGLRS